MAEKTINVAMGILGEVIQAALWPRTVEVQNVSHLDEDTVLTWNIAEGNGTFDPDNPFEWDPVPEGLLQPPTVTLENPTQLKSAAYRNTVTGSERVTWTYTVRITRSGEKIGIDPEVDNLPPLP